MKKLLITAFLGLCGFSIQCETIIIDPTQTTPTEVTQTEKRKRLLIPYITTFAIGCGVGTATGGALRYIAKKIIIKDDLGRLFVTALGWCLESELRHDIIAAFQQELDQRQIEHKKNLMFNGACFASWISYLQA